jgi:WD40 repeat protein
MHYQHFQLTRVMHPTRASVTTKEDLAAHHALFITTLKGHGDEITGIAWSPDAKLFATSCADMQVRLYDIHDLKGKDPKFRFLRTQYPPLGIGFGNEGNRMVVAVRGEEALGSFALLAVHVPWLVVCHA